MIANYNLHHYRSVISIMVLLLYLPVSTALAIPATSGNIDVEIPISELKKVRSNTSIKGTSNRPNKKKSTAKTEATKPEAAATTGVRKVAVSKASSKIIQTAPSSDNTQQTEFSSARTKVETEKKSESPTNSKRINTRTVPANVPVKAELQPELPTIQIHHTPYSFVVTGKRSKIQVVIDSKEDISEVYCTMRGVSPVKQNQIKMEKMAGSLFTYTAIIPEVPRDISSLSYKIVVVNSLGAKTISQEFSSPVKLSVTIPAWQLDDAVEAVPVNSKEIIKPLKDPVEPALTK